MVVGQSVSDVLCDLFTLGVALVAVGDATLLTANRRVIYTICSTRWCVQIAEVAVWPVCHVVGRINDVNQRWAWLVLGWVTICRRLNHLGLSVCKQPPRTTKPGHPSVGRRSELQQKLGV